MDKTAWLANASKVFGAALCVCAPLAAYHAGVKHKAVKAAAIERHLPALPVKVADACPPRVGEILPPIDVMRAAEFHPSTPGLTPTGGGGGSGGGGGHAVPEGPSIAIALAGLMLLNLPKRRKS